MIRGARVWRTHSEKVCVLIQRQQRWRLRRSGLTSVSQLAGVHGAQKSMVGEGAECGGEGLGYPATGTMHSIRPPTFILPWLPETKDHRRSGGMVHRRHGAQAFQESWSTGGITQASVNTNLNVICSSLWKYDNIHTSIPKYFDIYYRYFVRKKGSEETEKWCILKKILANVYDIIKDASHVFFSEVYFQENLC